MWFRKELSSLAEVSLYFIRSTAVARMLNRMWRKSRYFAVSNWGENRFRWQHRRSLNGGFRVRNPPGSRLPLYKCCLCCRVEVSVSGWSLVQRNPTESVCVSVFVCDISIMQWGWSSKGCCSIRRGKRWPLNSQRKKIYLACRCLKYS